MPTCYTIRTHSDDSRAFFPLKLWPVDTSAKEDSWRRIARDRATAHLELVLLPLRRRGVPLHPAGEHRQEPYQGDCLCISAWEVFRRRRVNGHFLQCRFRLLPAPAVRRPSTGPSPRHIRVISQTESISMFEKALHYFVLAENENDNPRCKESFAPLRF
jgi:hypothetical protein